MTNTYHCNCSGCPSNSNILVYGNGSVLKVAVVSGGQDCPAIHGYVLDTMGRPVRGVLVKLLRQACAPHHPMQLVDEVRTDANGAFCFRLSPCDTNKYYLAIEAAAEQTDWVRSEHCGC